MSAQEQDRIAWRRWAGLEVLARLMDVGPSEGGRVVLSAAVQKAYSLIHGAATETDLAVDIEILYKLGIDGNWRGAAKLLDARQALLAGRTQDPVAALVAGLAAKVGDGVGSEFLQGVKATQRFYQGEPDPLLLQLREIARPFVNELDLEILDGGPPAAEKDKELDRGTGKAGTDPPAATTSPPPSPAPALVPSPTAAAVLYGSPPAAETNAELDRGTGKAGTATPTEATPPPPSPALELVFSQPAEVAPTAPPPESAPAKAP